MKYPIGVQSFEELRKGGYVYVDKTAQIYELVTTSKFDMLSRPNCFGKSLLLSTMKAYFEGKKELFKGLAVEKLEKEWKQYPVLYLDLNKNNSPYDRKECLDEVLVSHLEEWEKIYGKSDREKDSLFRFKDVIRNAKEQTGLGVVLLVDDFDKPMLCAVNDRDLCLSFNRSLKTLYSLTKTLGYCIHFSCMVGLTKFSNLSIFSDFNNFCNISLYGRHADLCGINKEELHKYFDEPIRELAEEKKMTIDETYARLSEMYGGYHFAAKSEAVYNPFCLMSALKGKDFGEYWFESGTPPFLVDLIKSNDYDVEDLGNEMSDDYILCGADSEYIPLESMLYQSGYYTIKDFDKEFREYTLGFPNMEVENAFKNCLIKYFRKKE